MWFVCLYFHFLFCSICGCEAGTTMEDRGVGVCRCRQLLGGVVKYWEVWSIYCGLISNTVGLSVV